MFGYGMGWGMAFGWLFLVLLIIGIVLLVVALVRGFGGERGAPSGRDGRSRAREILDERYARGDIDTDEYHERLRELDGRA